MKSYNKIRLPVEEDLVGDSEVDQEIQDRDKAIVELWDILLNYYTNEEGDPTIALNKYDDFVTKTRAIYGM